MARILGLDLGTNSIGWAVVDDEKNVIEDTGVRIFPEGVEAKTIGTGEKEQSRNATRRDKRQMRRQFYRKRLRKIKLLEVLIEQKMCPLSMEELRVWKNWDRSKKTEGKLFPSSEAFKAWLRQNPYILRDKALQEELSLLELGRVFYHLIQRRGFLSNRKGDASSAKTIFEKGKPEENILPINETQEKIKDSSLGAYLNSISYKENQPYCTKTDKNDKEIRVRGRYTTRDMYIEEFFRIWKSQSRFLDIDKITVMSKKVREFKGAMTGKRNKKRLVYLQEKYGTDNVNVSERKKNITKVTTLSSVSLKEFLAGRIEELYNDDGSKVLQFKSNESVLFWQRPLKSQKGLLSNCRFENNLPVIDKNGKIKTDNEGNIIRRSKKPCPISHPEFEIFRAYQFINNIKYGKNPRLTVEEREKTLHLINKNDKNFDFIKIPKELKLTYEKFNYEDKQKVAGNYTIKHLSNLFSKTIWEKKAEEIWHCFYFYEDDDKLYKKLVVDYDFKKDIEAVKKIKLKDGYSNISLKAIRNITPFLEKGFQFDRAVVLGGVRNAFGKRWEYFKEFHNDLATDISRILNEDNKNGEAIEKIKDYLSSPIYSYGFRKDDPAFEHLYHHSQDVLMSEELEMYLPNVENLRNPIVQQGLHEMRRLVNNIIKAYQEKYGSDFHFDQIKVEMGRDLRNSKNERQETTYRIRENEAKNDEARARLSEYGLQPSRSNIQKYLMWKEIEDKGGYAQCPYTGKTISINTLFGTDNAIQIEHIIPYSISLNDSFTNKTLCEAHFNKDKGEKTPYQFYLENPDSNSWGLDSWEAIEERAFRLLPYHKAKRFTAKKEFEKSSFIERQLNDSRYIAKKAVELLSCICKDVRVMPGQLTAELRHLWGLNNILQPVEDIDKHLLKEAEEKAQAVYVKKGEDGKAISIQKKYNERPKTTQQEILLPYSVDKKKASSKHFQMVFETPDLENGNYWAKFSTNSDVKLKRKFIEKPETNESNIVFRGHITNGIFKNDTTGNISKTGQDDGVYWAKFDIENHKLASIEDQKDRPKIKAKKQICLFGNVYNREFKCYIYSCKTNLPNGKYWLTLDIDYNNVEFIKAINTTPSINSDEICILTSVDEQGTMVADVDTQYTRRTSKNAGKYYAVLKIEDKHPIFHPLENKKPKELKGEEIIEGSIWIDKYGGEIKFDPKKNREDHRHHAIDAIAIALTKQSYLQRLSTYNASRKEKQRGKLDSSEKYPTPWDDFTRDVQTAANSILISHRKDNKTLTKNKKGFSVRGQLHKENVFGKRQAPNSGEGFHRRTKITELKNHKHIAKIVDSTIRDLIRKHLQDTFYIDINNPKGYDVPKNAFYKDGKWQIFLPNKNGEPVPIKKVRIKENISNAAQLKTNLNQYVNPRNNHHVMIYKNNEGEFKEEVVQFWTVVERAKDNEAIFQMPKDGQILVSTLEINDMFLLGITNEEFEENINNRNFLSHHLYRVQKLSSMFYTFRHHLASTVNNKKEEKYVQSFGAWEALSPIKIRLNELGKITKI